MQIHRTVAALLVASASASGQIVADGSFEASGPLYPAPGQWSQFSTNFGTPLCNGECLGPGQPTAALTGQWWAWFGGIDTAFEQGTITQTVAIPPGAANLKFHLTAFSDALAGTDSLKVFIDSTEVFSINDQQLAPFTLDYALVTINLNAFAGASRVLKFDSVTNGSGFLTNFFVDDVEITTGGGTAPSCYPNCDQSTTTPFLNVNDFVCFNNAFAAGSTTANCDLSTAIPILNVNDFICFQNRFAAGCSAP
ncbi:MAG: hypothetical protein ACKVW3_18005 [Phycisphaerales bacterium]